MADLPTCVANRRGACPRSQTVLLKEADGYYVIGCRTCRSVQVLTKRHLARQEYLLRTGRRGEGVRV